MEDTYRSQFRLPFSLYERLKQAADENHRPLNTELIVRLESTFQQPISALGTTPADGVSTLLAQATLKELLTPTEFEALVQRLVERIAK